MNLNYTGGFPAFFCWLPAAGPTIDSAGRVVDSAHNQRSMQDRRPSEILHKSGSNGVLGLGAGWPTRGFAAVV